MNLTADQIARAAGASSESAAAWRPHLLAAMTRFGINTPERAAGFLAQIGHESGGLRRLIENLNYSAEALVRVWPTRFRARLPGESLDAEFDGSGVAYADAFARKPEKIANVVYANRLGNGSRDSGDGFRFRGRGLIQITGRANYRAAGEALALPLEIEPDLAMTVGNSPLIAAWFWESRGLNARADARDIGGMARLVNGGNVGLEHRTALYNEAMRTLMA